MQHQKTIVERLAALERQNRVLTATLTRQRRAVGMMAIMLAAVLTLGAGGHTADVVRAKRFVVMSEDGRRETIDLRTTPHGNGLLSVYQANGYPSVQLDTSPGIGGMMTVFDDRGYPMIRADVTAPHDGQLTGFNADGHRLFRLTRDARNDEYHGGTLWLENGSGRVSVRVPAPGPSEASPSESE